MDTQSPTELTGLPLAVSRMGGQKALAEALDVSAQAVSKWVKTGHAPVERAAEIEALTKVPRLELVDEKLRAFVRGATSSAPAEKLAQATADLPVKLDLSGDLVAAPPPDGVAPAVQEVARG